MVSNFSKTPVTISRGQALGIIHDPRRFLENRSNLTEKEMLTREQHANYLRTIVDLQTKDILDNDVINPEDEPVEGGPKIAETPEDPIPSSQLFETIDIAKDLDPEQESAIKAILWKNKQAFALDGRLGNYDEKIEIELKPGTKPVSLPPFPVSPAQREVMDKQMDSWIQLGVIEPSKSPWGAPAFIVWQNGKPRMVVDLRKLNEAAVRDEFPIPRQETIIQALHGSQWLTTLDALSGFTQLEIAHDSKPLLAFRTHRGLYQFRRLPFGFHSGPGIFQRVMQKVLAPFLWLFALVYIDDIVIFSTSFDNHLVHLDKVLTAIINSKITLSPTKCHIGYRSLLLLGQKVSRLGMSTHEEKVKAILNLAHPRSVKELQTFLGMVTYFSAYIPHFAWIVSPLFKLLKKGAAWEWNDVHTEAFEVCKQVLVNAPVRAYGIPGLPYRLYSDASAYGLAAILQQVQPIKVKELKFTRIYEKLKKTYKEGKPVPRLIIPANKNGDDLPESDQWNDNEFNETSVHIERVIGYWSRILKPAERNYSATEREMLALKEGLIKFQVYLEGEKVYAITDHSALTWGSTFHNVNRRLMTWGTILAAYPGLEIIHRAGRVHSNVDPISRLRHDIPNQDGPSKDISGIPLSIGDTSSEKDVEFFNEFSEEFESKIHYVAALAARSSSKDENTPPLEFLTEVDVSPSDRVSISTQSSNQYNTIWGMVNDEYVQWIKSYQDDPYFKAIWDELKDCQRDNVTSTMYPQYSLDAHGFIILTDLQGNHRLCVPEKFQWQIIKESHDDPMKGAHEGFGKLYNRIASTYYWKHMSRPIKQYVNSCDICQKAKPRRMGPIGVLQPIPVPNIPFEVISMDFIPHLPMTKNGFDNILVIVDKLTKFGIFIPTQTHLNEIETAQLVFNHIIIKYGIPKQIISDRDSRWSNSFWGELCKLMNIKRALTTSYHPQADGQTEVLNQTLEIALRCYVNPLRNNWDEYVGPFALSYNTSKHTATGFSPAFLLYGYEPRTSIDLPNVPGEYINRNFVQVRMHSEQASDIKETNSEASNKRSNRVATARASARLYSDSNDSGSGINRAMAECPSVVGDSNLARRSTEIGHTNSGNSKWLCCEQITTNTAARQLTSTRRANSFHSGPGSTLTDSSGMADNFIAARSIALDALLVSQVRQSKLYNQSRRNIQFSEGDQVLINPHSLRLLRDVQGLGRKLLLKYEGPFTINKVLGPNTYRLAMPASYGIHPVINATHLEPYTANSTPVIDRPIRELRRSDFKDLIEYEVERIEAERIRKKGKQHVSEYLIKWKGYDANYNTWEPAKHLKNAPDIIEEWKRRATTIVAPAYTAPDVSEEVSSSKSSSKSTISNATLTETSKVQWTPKTRDNTQPNRLTRSRRLRGDNGARQIQL